MKSVTLTVGSIAPELVRDGTKIRADVWVADETDGHGGKITVWIDPSNDLEDIKARAIAEAKDLFTRAARA